MPKSTSAQKKRAGAIVGVVVAIAALGGPIFGPMLLSADQTTTYAIPNVTLGSAKVACGSVSDPLETPTVISAVSWDEDSATLVTSELKAACDDELVKTKQGAIAWIVIGGVGWLGLGGLLIYRQAQKKRVATTA